MARIRTIKPEFFTSEDIVSLPPLSRLFYVSLWCEADRAGRLEWKPRTFKLRYFPGDDCNIEQMCNDLIDAGLVVVYEIDGKQFAEIPTFTEHQIINNRESESKIPPRVTGQIDASPTRESGDKAEGKGKEGKGRERKEGKEGVDRLTTILPDLTILPPRPAHTKRSSTCTTGLCRLACKSAFGVKTGKSCSGPAGAKTPPAKAWTGGSGSLRTSLNPSF